MSALTKVFVLLLVICSLLLSAGTIVFVNLQQNELAARKTAEAEVEKARVKARSEIDEAVAARDALNTSLVAANSALDARDNTIIELRKQLADKGVENATLAKNFSSQSLDVSRLTEGLAAAQTQIASLRTEQGEIRSNERTLVTENSQLNQRNSELSNELDATERARRNLAEQLVQIQQDNNKLSGLLKDYNINPDQAGGLRSGAVAIRGVVRQVRPIDGIPYATISVGSTDSVTKGMEFKVIDIRNQQFLGTLRVELVEANEATGRLQGPRIQDVHAGAEVTTQLQG